MIRAGRGFSHAEAPAEYTSTRAVRAVIDLSAVVSNVLALREMLGSTCRLAAVVKANGYGLGAVPVALAALRGGASFLAVACVDEGVELRLAGIAVPVLVMGYVRPEEAQAVVEYGLSVALHRQRIAAALEQAAISLGKPERTVAVHIKVDTGLGRFGCTPEEVVPLARSVAGLAHLRLEGLMTHFAEADAPDLSYSRRQLEVFEDVRHRLNNAAFTFDVVHASNSAGAIALPEARYDMVRAGLTLTGYLPGEHLSSTISLRRAVSLVAQVARVFSVRKGETVGYGRTWAATGDSVVALVPVGYADGYPRALSNRAQVLVSGVRCPVVGRVSMDQIAVDVTACRGVAEGDEVVLIGRQGAEEISADDVARWAGTISYEILCGIAPRVPRVYLWEGREVGRTDLIGAAPVRELP